MKAVIIGGGASGIACAIRLKQNIPDCDVTVIEHLDSPCKKLFATGNGRCNITNVNADNFEITKGFFTSLGLVLRESNEGRMYPYSNQALTIVNLLSTYCEKLKIKIITECNAYKIEKHDSQFNIFTSKGIIYSDVLILATGGMAQKALGSDGSGYELVKSMGHSVTELTPSLVQLTSSSKNCRALKGIRTKCTVTIETNGENIASEFGELLFTDYGISGIVTMDLSKYVNDARLKSRQDKTVAVVDFVPDMSVEELSAHMEEFGTLEGLLPHKLCKILDKQSDGDTSKIPQYAKSWRIIITGTKGFDFAQITNGGVPNSELKDNNESALCDDLYIIGELTDNQYRCGGFNLDYAFSSGVKAADRIAQKEIEKNDKN